MHLRRPVIASVRYLLEWLSLRKIEALALHVEDQTDVGDQAHVQAVKGALSAHEGTRLLTQAVEAAGMEV